MVEHAATPTEVGQVDDDVAGRIQGGGRRPDRHGLAGTDFTGDDPDGVLIDTRRSGPWLRCGRGGGAAWPGPDHARRASG